MLLFFKKSSHTTTGMPRFFLAKKILNHLHLHDFNGISANNEVFPQQVLPIPPRSPHATNSPPHHGSWKSPLLVPTSWQPVATWRIWKWMNMDEHDSVGRFGRGWTRGVNMNDSCQHFLRSRVSCKSIQAPMIKTCIPIGGSQIIDQQSKSSSNQVFRDEI